MARSERPWERNAKAKIDAAPPKTKTTTNVEQARHVSHERYTYNSEGEERLVSRSYRRPPVPKTERVTATTTSSTSGGPAQQPVPRQGGGGGSSKGGYWRSSQRGAVNAGKGMAKNSGGIMAIFAVCLITIYLAKTRGGADVNMLAVGGALTFLAFVCMAIYHANSGFGLIVSVMILVAVMLEYGTTAYKSLYQYTGKAPAVGQLQDTGTSESGNIAGLVITYMGLKAGEAGLQSLGQRLIQGPGSSTSGEKSTGESEGESAGETATSEGEGIAGELEGLGGDVVSGVGEVAGGAAELATGGAE